MPGIPMPGISTLWSKSTIFQSCRQGIPMPGFPAIWHTAWYAHPKRSRIEPSTPCRRCDRHNRFCRKGIPMPGFPAIWHTAWYAHPKRSRIEPSTPCRRCDRHNRFCRKGIPMPGFPAIWHTAWYAHPKRSRMNLQLSLSRERPFEMSDFLYFLHLTNPGETCLASPLGLNCTSRAPTAAIPSPTPSCQLSLSPRKIQARMAI